MAEGHDPNWGVIGATAVAIATAFGTFVAAVKGAFRDQRSDRQQGEDREDARQQQRDKSSIDRTALTLDNVFKLVEQLQEEVKRKDQQIADVEMRAAARIEALDLRLRVQEDTIAAYIARIAALEREIRQFKEARS